ncbi:MAG: sigma-54 interaction domain-containing protein, partial [Anaerovoracaceae bacterium]
PISRNEVIGRSVFDIDDIYRPSAAALALREKRKVSLLQRGMGDEAIATSVPIFDDKGEIQLVISTGRYISELKLLEEYYRYKSKEPKANAEYIKEGFVYTDVPMKKIMKLVEQISNTDSNILITGETGTGKSLLARYIHENSDRSSNNFIEINCSAIPETLIESELFGYDAGAFTGAKKTGKAGLIEMADGGTLFLDEIGDIPLNLQTKLLNVLQSRKITRIGSTKSISVDIRLITATHRDLEKMMKDESFREDLYYRINVVPLHIPSLRERTQAIPMLTNSFIKKFCKKYKKEIIIHDLAVKKLCAYKWPGNIRELENLIERLVVTNITGVIEEKDISEKYSYVSDNDDPDIIVNRIIFLKNALEEVESQLVKRAFNEYGSTYKVAEILGISQSAASRKRIKYMIP